MGAVYVLIIWSIVAIGAQCQVTLEPDRPYKSVKVSESHTLECCFTTPDNSFEYTWVKRIRADNFSVQYLTKSASADWAGKHCGTYNIKMARVNDSGFYQCMINGSINAFTHGTYLQVLRPLEKTINLSENTKNRILIAEGLLLFLCVLLPSSTLLFKSKKLHELEKKKTKREEENIYQGLNLDDCCTTYDQIERSKADGPYQDVANIDEEDDSFQLEKP